MLCFCYNYVTDSPSGGIEPNVLFSVSLLNCQETIFRVWWVNQNFRFYILFHHFFRKIVVAKWKENVSGKNTFVTRNDKQFRTLLLESGKGGLRRWVTRNPKQTYNDGEVEPVYKRRVHAISDDEEEGVKGRLLLPVVRLLVGQMTLDQVLHCQIRHVLPASFLWAKDCKETSLVSQSATSLSARSLPSASKATNTETGLAKYVANTHCLPHVVCPRPANSHTQCLGIHTNSRTWLSVDKPTEGRRCCDLDPEICQRSVHIHDADHRGDNLSLSSLLHLTKTTIKKIHSR